MIDKLGIGTVTNDGPPERANDGDEKGEAAKGRDAGTTSGTENYGGTEDGDDTNPPDRQTEPSY